VTRALLEVRAGNSSAQALYTECGFVPLGRREQYYNDPPEDALVLVREG
jgi:ribosomal-protein-alanine N-acetyltransferase